MLCILSNASASCSLSIGVDAETDASELRRDPKPRVSKDGGPEEACGESWEDILTVLKYSYPPRSYMTFRGLRCVAGTALVWEGGF